MTRDEIASRFRYYPPSPASQWIHEAIRERLMAAAEVVAGLCPEGREKSLAVTKLEEAMFWANAAVARGARDNGEGS